MAMSIWCGQLAHLSRHKVAECVRLCSVCAQTRISLKLSKVEGTALRRSQVALLLNWKADPSVTYYRGKTPQREAEKMAADEKCKFREEAAEMLKLMADEKAVNERLVQVKAKASPAYTTAHAQCTMGCCRVRTSWTRAVGVVAGAATECAPYAFVRAQIEVMRKHDAKQMERFVLGVLAVSAVICGLMYVKSLFTASAGQADTKEL
eukprot:515387-Pleurochrysis_carterae.AAC.1